MKLQAKHSLLEEQMKVSQRENGRLGEELARRVEKERGTKGKLKEWVNLARQNLNQG